MRLASHAGACTRSGPTGALMFARATLAPLHPAPTLCPDLHGYGADVRAEPGTITIDTQVEHLRAAIDQALPGGRVHLVGHSVGGVIAAAFAHRFPERTASLVSVEGNFSLSDAFWSRQLASKTAAEVEQIVQADRADPGRWLRAGGIEPTRERLRSATQDLAYQPASTIHAMARTVVEYTAGPDYQQLLRDVFERVPVHLVAGARSRAGWDVPAWALSAAASYTELPRTGHMVMLEAPEEFGALLAGLLAPASAGQDSTPE
ncbi:alpha/beta hydrolase [Streptomyces sp. NPDC094149]|uniref:alpha/beta fold hydrolase n=1 Tax=Streptomyces sp. NPDC094149 TaxID=3155079 RepID=UPI00332926C7